MHKLETQLNRKTYNIWGLLCELKPALIRFDPPKIELCNRIYRTAGLCHWHYNKIQLSAKAYNQGFAREMNKTILPHEIIHQAHFNILGCEPPELEWHGGLWSELMVKYGLPANEFHSMDISR